LPQLSAHSLLDSKSSVSEKVSRICHLNEKYQNCKRKAQDFKKGALAFICCSCWGAVEEQFVQNCIDLNLKLRSFY